MAFEFSYFDSRIYSHDMCPKHVYVVQHLVCGVWRDIREDRYVKDKGSNWSRVPDIYDDIRDAIIQMHRRSSESDEQYENFRVVCRTDVPVAFDFKVTPVDLRDHKEEGDEMESR